MKITDRFIGDHKTFRKLMKDIESMNDTDQPADRRRLIRAVELLMDHLLLHSWGEDTFYYPEVTKGSAASSTVIDRAYMVRMEAEHEAIDSALQDVENLIKASASVQEWRARYDDFRSRLLSHMKQEEDELFPLSEKILGAAALERISDTLEKNRKNAPAIRLHQRL